MRLAPLCVIALGALGGALAAAADSPRTTVAVDLSALDEATYRRIDALALEKRILLRLVQEHFAAVAASESPRILVRLTVLPDRVVIEARGGRGAATREVVTADEPVRELQHLEIAQKVVDLVRLQRGDPSEVPPAVPLAPPVPAVSAAPVPPPLALEVRAGGAALVRGGGADPAVRLELRGGLGPALGVALGVGVVPASRGAVRVLEAQIEGGAGYRAWWTPRLSAEAGVRVGVLVHRYSIDDAEASARAGTRFDLVASAPLAIAFWPRPWLACELYAIPGVAGGRRAHMRRGVVLWERGAFRGEGGMSIAWRFR